MPIDGASRIERIRTVVFVAMCVLIGVLATPVRPGVVLGESMAPAFHSGQVFLTSRVPNPEGLRKGDVVLVAVDDQVFLKRVFALGGDRVWLLESAADEQEAPQVVLTPDLPRSRPWAPWYGEAVQLHRLTIPEKHVYVLGDSLANSYDSRHFGPVPWEAVRGRVVVSRLFRLWRPDAGGVSLALAGEPETVRRTSEDGCP
jgi:signal peptidase I